MGASRRLCGAWLYGTLSVLLSVASGARAEPADDWSLTRPARRAQSSARAQPARSPAVAQGSALAGRYLRAALADPSDLAVVQRLVRVYEAEPRGIDALLATRAASAPGDARIPVLRAQLERLRSDPAAARTQFALAATLDDDGSAHRAWAAFEREQGDRPRCVELLEVALSRTRGGAVRLQLLMELGELVLEGGDHARAAQHFAELRRASPGSVGAELAYARALSARSEHVLAADEYARALSSLRGDPRVLPAVLVEAAKAQIAAGRVEAALATLSRARTLSRRDPGMRGEVAETLLSLHRERGSLAELAVEAGRSGEGDDQRLSGRAYEELGRADDALACYRRVLARAPGDVATRRRVIAVLARSGRIEDVIAEQRALVRAAPQDAEAVLELAVLLSDAGRRAEALTLLAESGARNPRDVRLHRRMAELYARFREQAALDRELALLAKLDPHDESHVIALGEAQLSRGKPELARETWRRLLQGADDSALAHARLGEVYLQHDLLGDALAAYDRAASLRPDDASIARGRAEVLERQLRTSDAAREWQRVLVLGQGDRELAREVRKRLVNLWAELGELATHVAELEKKLADAEAVSRMDVETGLFLANAYERLSRGNSGRADATRSLQLAERTLLRIVASAPSDVESWQALERLRARAGDIDGAIAALEQLVQLDAHGAPGYLARMVDHARSRYRDADAIRYAERACLLAPNDARAHERLGDLYLAQQDTPRALASYERALSLDAGRSSLLLRVSEIALSQGDSARAQALRLRALRESTDEELLSRAFRASRETCLAAQSCAELEAELLQVTLAHPDRTAHRRMLVDLCALVADALARRADAGDAAARTELQALAQRGMKPLLAALADHDVEQVRAAVAVLTRAPSASAAAPLLLVASAPDPRIDVSLRVRALSAAASVLPSSLLPRVLVLAQGPEPRLREVSAWIIAHDPQGRALSRELLQSSDPVVRAQALLGIARLREPGDRALLQGALATDRSGWVRGVAAVALGSFGGPEASVALREATRVSDTELARAAWLGLALHGEPALATELSSLVFGTDPRLREIGGLGLRAATGVVHEPLALPAPLEPSTLETFLEHARAALAARPGQPISRFSSELAGAASRALHSRRGLAALSVLDVALQGDGAAAPLDASTAAAVAEQLSAELVALTGQRDAALRVPLARVLGRVHGQAVEPALAGMLADADARVQIAVLDALALRERLVQPQALVPRLGELALRAPSFGVRLRATAVLGGIGGADATRILARALATDGYALVRESAAAALGRHPDALAAKALLAALAGDDEMRVRGAAAGSLVRLGGDALAAARRAQGVPEQLRAILSAN